MRAASPEVKTWSLISFSIPSLSKKDLTAWLGLGAFVSSIYFFLFLLISLSFFLVSCGGGGGGTAASGNPYGGGTPASSCSSDYCITVVNTASGNKYAVNGSTQAAITITAGQTKTFDLSDSSLSGHPFALSKRADGRNAGTVVSADTLGASDGVTTASNVQVRSPINTKSLGGWKNYKEMLRPAMEIITQKYKYKDLKY